MDDLGVPLFLETPTSTVDSPASHVSLLGPVFAPYYP